MTANGVAMMVRRRGRQAGIDGPHPHQFRTPSPDVAVRSGTEGGLMRVAGWRDRWLLSRYGPAARRTRPATPTAVSPPAIAFDTGPTAFAIVGAAEVTGAPSRFGRSTQVGCRALGRPLAADVAIRRSRVGGACALQVAQVVRDAVTCWEPAAAQAGSRPSSTCRRRYS